MSLFSDLKILYQMAVRPIRGENHAQRMDNFYQGQAKDYDDFRKRLLKGRESLWQHLLKENKAENPIWLDMGGGTGANLEFFGDSINKIGKVYVVDLATSLLKMADQRIADKKWANVSTVCGDATAFTPPEGSVDVITFSYSLTMIPNWFSAVEHAYKLLKPGGLIGVVDFYVSRKHPEEGFKKHNWGKRVFWPNWFAADNVFPSPDHLPYLNSKFKQVQLEELTTKIPYFFNPFARMPYYIFVGRKNDI